MTWFFKKGNSRLVLVVPSLNIVFKFPMVRLIYFLKTIGKMVMEGQWENIKKTLRDPSSKYGSAKKILFKGIIDNIQEFKFCLLTQHVCIEPTYLSLLGLVNVQRYGKTETLSPIVMIDQFLQIIGDQKKVAEDEHHFNNSKNFSFRGDKIRFIDYGDPQTRRIILESGNKISTTFDIFKARRDHEANTRQDRTTNEGSG